MIRKNEMPMDLVVKDCVRDYCNVQNVYFNARLTHVNAVILGWALALIGLGLNLQAGNKPGVMLGVLALAFAWVCDRGLVRVRFLKLACFVASAGSTVAAYGVWWFAN